MVEDVVNVVEAAHTTHLGKLMYADRFIFMLSKIVLFTAAYVITETIKSFVFDLKQRMLRYRVVDDPD